MKKLLLLLLICAGCGSVQTINGVKIKHKKDTRTNPAIFVGTFFLGYYLVDSNMKKK